jgi:hypothetical protein
MFNKMYMSGNQTIVKKLTPGITEIYTVFGLIYSLKYQRRYSILCLRLPDILTIQKVSDGIISSNLVNQFLVTYKCTNLILGKCNGYFSPLSKNIFVNSYPYFQETITYVR